MTKLTTAILIALSAIFFIGCQKEASVEPSTAGANLTGNYKFVSAEVESIVTMQTNQAGEDDKTVTQMHYISKNNSGSVKFDAKTASSSNIAYTVDTIMKAWIYVNGSLQDSMTLPVQVSTPPSSSIVPYELIGKDSIYFPAGLTFVDASNASTAPATTKPSRGRFKVEGDKLYITSSIDESGVKDVQGLHFYSSTKARTVMILQKQ